MSKNLYYLAALAFVGVMSTSAIAQDFHLKMQTHYSPESTSGKLAQSFIDDVQTMSNGRIEIEMFWSSSLVKSVEGFDAAASGILDGEMHGASYLTGKNSAFQFVGDPMGGYDNPWQLYEFLYNGGGLEAANKLYNKYNMQFVGWWAGGQESLVSTTSIAGIDDLKGWKFRSPPGLETQIFAGVGSSPVVMDFTEVYTALETGIIAGADHSTIANNLSAGDYDQTQFTTYPGFHSMPVDHVTFNLDVWKSLPADLQAIINVAAQKLALTTTMTFDIANREAAAAVAAKGITVQDWSAVDRKKFREVSMEAWNDFADTPEAKDLVAAHLAFLKRIGSL